MKQTQPQESKGRLSRRDFMGTAAAALAAVTVCLGTSWARQ